MLTRSISVADQLVVETDTPLFLHLKPPFYLIFSSVLPLSILSLPPFLPSLSSSPLPLFLPLPITPFLSSLPPYPSSPPGTRGYESQEKDRPQFRGDPSNPLKRSFITNRKETYYPQQKRIWFQIYSVFVVFISVILSISFFGACFYAEYLVMTRYTEFNFSLVTWIVIFVIACAIEIFSAGYLVLSERLTNNENHKTETNYEDALISKTLFFKLFNHYSALIFTAFFKGPFLHTCEISCLIDLQQLLYGIFIVRISISLWEISLPYIKKFFTFVCCWMGRKSIISPQRGDKDIYNQTHVLESG